MDARSYLKGQGWRGEGHSLDTTNRGLARPLLVTHKGDLTGLGTKKNDFSDQWWMTSFDKNLKGLGQTPPDTPRESLPQLPGFKHKNLYSNFVKAETLESTFKNDTRLAKLAFPDGRPMQEDPEKLARRRSSVSSTVKGFVLGLAQEDMQEQSESVTPKESKKGDKKRKRGADDEEDHQEEKDVPKKKSKREKKQAKKEKEKKKKQQDQPEVQVKEKEKKEDKYKREKVKRAAKQDAKVKVEASTQNGASATSPNTSTEKTERKKKKKKKKCDSKSEDAADADDVPPVMFGKYTIEEQRALRYRLKQGRKQRSKAAQKERKKTTGFAKSNDYKKAKAAESAAQKASTEGQGA